MNEHVLVLDNPKDRTSVLNKAKQLGVKIKHDSGGRLIIFDSDLSSNTLLKKLPKGIKKVAVDEENIELRKTLSENDKLFISALKLRKSKKYCQMKAAQIPGESEQEKLLVTGSCQMEE